MIFVILTVMNLQTGVFRNVTACCLVDTYNSFGTAVSIQRVEEMIFVLKMEAAVFFETLVAVTRQKSHS
jgi:hypothetical protein